MGGHTKPYTPDSLADRWGCSGELIRQMLKRGELPGFKVGTMCRIPAAAVEEHETCQNSASGACEADFASPGMMPTPARDGAISLRHARERKPNQKL